MSNKDRNAKTHDIHCCCCSRIAAAAAAVVVAVALVVGKWKTPCRMLLSSLLVLPCSRFFLPHFSASASSAELWVSLALSSSRACSAALMAAHQIRRRPRAVRMCGPPSIRIHHRCCRVVAVGKTTCSVLLSFLPMFPCSHFSLSPPATLSVSRVSRAALVAARHTLRRPRAVRKCGPLSTRTHLASFHHAMCLFDTSLSSCIEFVSLFASTHSSCLVISSFPSCPSWASTLPSLLLSLSLSCLSFSLLLSSHFFLSRLALVPVVSHSSIPLALALLLSLPSFSCSSSASVSLSPPSFPSSSSQSAHLIHRVSHFSSSFFGSNMAWVCDPPAPMLGAIRPKSCSSPLSSPFFVLVSCCFPLWPNPPGRLLQFPME